MHINKALQTHINFSIITILFCAVFIISCGNKTNQKEFLTKHKNFTKKFESKVSNIYETYNLQGDFLLALVNENGLAYSFAMNKKILNNKPTNLDNNSPIYIASHTKAFTGTLLKILEENEKINLNKSVHDYLPELKLLVPKFNKIIYLFIK